MSRYHIYMWPVLLAPLVVGLVIGLAAFGLVDATSPPPASAVVCGSLPLGTALPDGSRFNPAQAANAATIISVAHQAGIGQTGAVIAITAAFTESRLINTPSGDADSLGLFQERPSQGWGSPAQIMDPTYATTQFLNHLSALPNWQSLAPANAAQAVERSAFPDRYAAWVAPATQLVAGSTGTGQCTNADSFTAAPVTVAGYTMPAGSPNQVIAAMSYALAQLGKPYVWGAIGPDGYDCSGLTMQAYHAAGIALPRTTYDQVYAGQPVYDLQTLVPGDLLFTEGADPGAGGAPGHVGMYLGAGVVIDAPHTGASVELTKLAGWRNQIVAARRMVPAPMEDSGAVGVY